MKESKGKCSFRLIIFDVDGVLADTSSCHRMAYDELWAKLEIDGPSYESIAGRRTIEVVRETTSGLDPTGREIESWVRFKQQRAVHYIKKKPVIYEDVVPNVKKMGGRYTLAIGSGASKESVDAIVQALGLEGVFEVTRTASDVKLGKPHPQIYVDIMETCSTGPERTLIIEDSTVGLAAAKASNAYHVSVRTHKGTDSDRFLGAFFDLEDLVSSLDLI